MKTVKDMYNALTSGQKLLSDYNADFWNEYRNNSGRYDKLFVRLYRSFKYFLQDGDETIGEVTSDFVADVYNHLMINDKKYSELYRIYVVNDNDYSLLDNYHLTEDMDRDTTSNDTNTYGSRIDSTTLGSRSDSGSETLGTHTDGTTNKVAPYNNSSFQNDNSSDTVYGSQSNSNSYTKGSETDDYTKGQQSDTLNNTGTEDYTLTRKGNIGTMTGADMLNKHDNYWTVYKFYQLIFKDIATELLLV